MRSEVRLMVYENGAQFIVDLATLDVYGESIPEFHDLFDDVCYVTYNDKEFISITEISTYKPCKCRKKDCLKQSIIRDAKITVERVLKDACDS